jgi:hypothetical protein
MRVTERIQNSATPTVHACGTTTLLVTWLTGKTKRAAETPPVNFYTFEPRG